MRRNHLNTLFLVLGFSFLYVPILILVVYSFNESRLVTVWGGLSLRWYASLLQNEAMLNAAWTSLQVGVASATIATVLGVAIAFALARHGRFRGRTLLAVIAFAPLVVPEIITGLSLLLFFVAMSVERGILTVVLAHATFASAFVATVVRARLLEFDRSLEEAAQDLGCPRFRVFLTITLPIIAPGIAAGWLLAFTLSLDDLVIASFTSGPDATTLPMRIFSAVRLGVSPEINAICTVLIVLVAFGAVVASRFTRTLFDDADRREAAS